MGVTVDVSKGAEGASVGADTDADVDAGAGAVGTTAERGAASCEGSEVSVSVGSVVAGLVAGWLRGSAADEVGGARAA